MAESTSNRDDHFGWHTFRLPPPAALIFGAAYGAIAGAIIAWDIAVVIRGGKLVRKRIADEIDRRRRDD